MSTMVASASKASVKGSALKSTLAVIQQELGAERYQQLLARLGDEERKFLSGPVLATDFYPFELSNKITAAAAGVLGLPETLFARTVGKRACEMAVQGIYKWMLSGIGAVGGNSGIKYIISKGSTFWSQIYDRGRLRVESPAANQALVILEDFPSVPITCARITGWLEAMLERAGTKNSKVVHPRCRGEGAARCEWLGRWD